MKCRTMRLIGFICLAVVICNLPAQANDTDAETGSLDINTFNSATMTAYGNTTDAPALAAHHEGTGRALFGISDSGSPTIEGENSGSGNGVKGTSSTGIGVYGYSNSIDSFGVVGILTGYSTSDLGSGYWEPGGFFGGRNGVVGVTKENNGRAIFGIDRSSSTGWAGYFISINGNGVYISAPNAGLNVASGTKNAVVRTNDGSRLMYTEESTKVWFSDYGFGKLNNDKVVITIDQLYAQTVNLNEPYHVFLQAYGDAELYVSNRRADSFEVHLREGDVDVEFSYRIVAPRMGHEVARMERAAWADNDPNLYPEKAGKIAMVPKQTH